MYALNQFMAIPDAGRHLVNVSLTMDKSSWGMIKLRFNGLGLDL